MENKKLLAICGIIILFVLIAAVGAYSMMINNSNNTTVANNTSSVNNTTNVSNTTEAVQDTDSQSFSSSHVSSDSNSKSSSNSDSVSESKEHGAFSTTDYEYSDQYQDYVKMYYDSNGNEHLRSIDGYDYQNNWEG